ncbi:MAG: helix-turn-helix transcriptional regulator [Alloprevotella sp.]|nr:helix-turn-helix transcriptional regulator [Prevotella sp.]MBR1712711.1 helix-turn-helix transcriptional regulator [Alloprevotella sp.]
MAKPLYDTCPIRQVISRFSDKWSLLILYTLHSSPEGVLRFNELRRHMEDCSQKMLSQTLRRLEQANLISRKVYAQVPPRVDYSLTPVGTSLMPAVIALIEWSLAHFNDVVSRDVVVD